jgi:protein-glutamine gamma-glutamyltransferase
MRTPPLLLGATLLFWGWQTGFLAAAAIMAVVLEGARLVRARWDLSDEDFRRTWTFCSVLLLAAVVYAFNTNDWPAQFSHLLQNPSPSNRSGVGNASARTATAVFRWLPMIFFLFVAAQTYSSRQEIPLTAISRLLRRRWRRAEQRGRPLLQVPGVNLAFPYFAVCLFAASTHPGETSLYFWGLCALLAWALWSQRSRRFRFLVWPAVFALAITLGYTSQRDIGRLQNYLTDLNPEWLARFVRRGSDPVRSRTSIGRVGNMKLSGAIVIRLQPRTGGPPTYLREASYRTFKSPTVWSTGGYRENFESLLPETNGTTWLLLPAKTNADRVQIACYLDRVSRESGQRTGLLPVPAGSDRLENLPAFTLRKNSAGALVAEGPGLVLFETSYGPGAMIDSAPDTNEDLSVPATEQAALNRVISELPVKPAGTIEALAAIAGLFRSNFSYSTWQEAADLTSTNETPLSRFLLRTRSGHCEYFATATVLLLRTLQIPARYAVGYAVHEASGKGYVVRQRDGHAWCLVWDDQAKTWLDFDTTPALWVAEESKRASPFQRLSDLWSWIGFQFSQFLWGHIHLRQYLLFTLVPVLAVLLYQILFRRKRRPKRPPPPATRTPILWPGLDSEFYLIEGRLAGRGLLRRPDEPLSGWLERTTHQAALAPLRQPLHELLRLHYRCRFDPHGLSPYDRDQLKRGARNVLDALGK